MFGFKKKEHAELSVSEILQAIKNLNEDDFEKVLSALDSEAEKAEEESNETEKDENQEIKNEIENESEENKEMEKPTTLEEVRKAYENLDDNDKKSFHQSIADRIHESIGEQEAEHGQKDGQSAADREHEALGAEHAAGKGDVSELHETDPKDKTSDLERRISALEEKLGRGEDKREKYGMSAKPSYRDDKKNYSDEDIERLLGK